MTTIFRFDPIDLERIRLLGRLSPAGRVRLMLNARELAVGLMRGRLHHRYAHLDAVALNLKLLEELDYASSARTRAEPVF